MSLKNFSNNKINVFFLILTLLVSYIYFFPRWADANQNSRLDMVVAVVDDGTLAIDKYVNNTVDFAHFGNHYYSDKAPGSAILGIPIYAALEVFLKAPIMDKLVTRLSNNQAFEATLKTNGSGIYTDKVRFAIAQVTLTFFISVLPSILLCLLLYFLLLDFGLAPLLSVITVLIYGLLTPAFTYAGAYYDHQLSTALLVGAFFLAHRIKSSSIPRMLLIGLFLAYSVLSEYQTVLVAGIIFLYTFFRLYQLKHWKQIGWVTLVAGLGAVGMMVYNRTVFGNPFNLGYQYSEYWNVQFNTGFMNVTTPQLDAIWGITFSVFRGLFILSPVLLLAVPGFIPWWREKQLRLEFWTSLAIVSVMFLFNSSSINWWGGFSVGPRYFLPAIPFMAIAIGFSLKTWAGKSWFIGLALLLSICSLAATWGMTLAGQSYPPDTIQNPFLDYLLPNWQVGNIARNFATVAGLPGIKSLIPLLAFLVTVAIIWAWLSQENLKSVSLPMNTKFKPEVNYSDGK